MNSIRVPESVLQAFAVQVFSRLGATSNAAELAARSLLDASLMGITTHGIESLDMYATHIRSGGLKIDAEPVCLHKRGSVELWDMRHGLGLAAARTIMSGAIVQARTNGIHFATCRNANHVGACGVYAKMAADEGMIGIVCQQAIASLAPWGGRDVRCGSAPFALAAPVKDGFPFYFDASMAAITRGRIKAHRRTGELLPEGAAMDREGRPTRDPEEAWHGQIMPIGAHKGVGLAMAFEILSCVLSGNQFSQFIPSIVDHPERSADSSFFVMAIDPLAFIPLETFSADMKRYVESIESSRACHVENPPCYPGRGEGASWLDRRKNGIPIDSAAITRFEQIARSIGLDELGETLAGYGAVRSPQ